MRRLLLSLSLTMLCACGSESSPAPAPSPPSEPNIVVPPAPPPVTTLIGPYKDVTIGANWETYEIDTFVTGSQQSMVSVPGIPVVTWAFATGECGSESWGGIPGKSLADDNAEAWGRAGRQFILSTGGAVGEFTCASDARFSAFLDRYASDSLIGVDFDIETGQSPAVVAALVSRVAVAKAAHPDLRFSFTVTTLGGNQPDSLWGDAHTVMTALQNANVTGVYVNLMTMDFGGPNPALCVVGSNGACDMGASSIAAVENFHLHYGWPYEYIEATPMIGGNDVRGDVFTLADAAALRSYALAKGLGGIHWWSLDRDTDCPPGYARGNCNSYGQAGPLGFAHAFLGD